MQFGFMKGMETTDAIFIVRHMRRISELKERHSISARQVYVGWTLSLSPNVINELKKNIQMSNT